MTKIVVDTNVIISAALSPNGNPAKIIAYIADHEHIWLCYSSEILAEYTEVLSRPRLKIPVEKQAEIVSAIKRIGILIKPTTSAIPMPDENDRIFYDTAQCAGALLITGNIKHFPYEPYIMTPSDFLKKMSD